ncbi:hypothetical protein BWD10_11740 [Neisseria zoodegmatis]|uniref:Uncharacterized protein n=1 Tax=Neisseria zoodegmatis TaxID=326523 RepID=A0ABX3WD05_9NEIS|nr:hypothetical protein BWD10_11740 [Neisseria zoodegmatis]
MQNNVLECAQLFVAKFARLVFRRPLAIFTRGRLKTSDTDFAKAKLVNFAKMNQSARKTVCTVYSR